MCLYAPSRGLAGSSVGEDISQGLFLGIREAQGFIGGTSASGSWTPAASGRRRGLSPPRGSASCRRMGWRWARGRRWGPSRAAWRLLKEVVLMRRRGRAASLAQRALARFSAAAGPPWVPRRVGAARRTLRGNQISGAPRHRRGVVPTPNSLLDFHTGRNAATAPFFFSAAALDQLHSTAPCARRSTSQSSILRTAGTRASHVRCRPTR